MHMVKRARVHAWLRRSGSHTHTLSLPHTITHPTHKHDGFVRNVFVSGQERCFGPVLSCPVLPCPGMVQLTAGL
jgi:hypothetical protein